MRAPAFWQAPRPSALARLLQPAGALVGALAARRMARAGERAAVPVICIGNPTVGGAGKTPTALAIAEHLALLGPQAVFLTRGYGGRLAGPEWVVPGQHGAGDVGDEPLLLARHAPTVLSRDRVAGAAMAAAGSAGVVVMDDGLQNPGLAKDLSLAVIDAGAGIGNGLVLPAGPLRAPLRAQWPRIDALVVLGEGERAEGVAGEARALGKPVLRARLVPDPVIASRLEGVRVLAFAGIGRPAKFFRTLDDLGAQVVARESFPDHHPFTAREIEAMTARAAGDGLLPVTTEKDMMRIAALRVPRLMERIVALPVRAVFSDEAALRALLGRALARGA
ncbi:tetraacyldisaccharide 4'-kinase [Salinarimonas soli]|uniref:Tetraacyldisaccharide 4'-kinase n=1 Tax=Salinarimonas soli TaxID=1638099 RepID=A0A5B2VCQ3_9HYPH|nr:tetraacyldisaccharide 4'-kinase [Salinarimonas soli]KAA2236240.1 tetraacyldisaccharide 4'-kinase [Salinarimonas soli]